MSVTPARRAAFEVLRRTFEHDAWTDRALPAAIHRHGVEGRERGAAQSLAYGAVKRRGTADALAERLSSRPVSALDPPVVAALRLGLFELLFADGAAHAVVGECVELAKGGMRGGGPRRARGAAGMVNAILRRAAAERDSLLASLTDETPGAAALAHSVPEWLARLWWEELGPEDARSLMRAVNEPAETAMRANRLKGDPRPLRERLAEAGEPVEPAPPAAGIELPEGIVWRGPLGDAALAALERGEILAQSRGAQAVVEALAPEPGERVLDLCAGPGVKTSALAARVSPSGSVTAVERDDGRASQISELTERAGAANVEVVVADAREADGRAEYDRVLVDPPCSDLGTIASRPDARWRKDPETIERLAGIQREILAAGRRALRPGGRLVYSTCTISRRENEDVTGVDAAVARTRPDLDGTDGFYIAAFGEGAG